MKRFLKAAVVAAAVAAVSAPAQAQVRITGTTGGCFYTVAYTCLSNPYNGLTFTGGSFDFSMANPGNSYELSTLSDFLGTFKLAANTDFDFGGSLRFRLSVNFTAPSAAVPNPANFIADFEGDVDVDHNNDKLDIDFNNSFITVDYTGAGNPRFSFRVNDLLDLKRTQPDGQLLTGKIACYEGDDESEVDTCAPPPAAQISSVPEPSTYALMAAGLAALGIVARRRKGSEG